MELTSRTPRLGSDRFELCAQVAEGGVSSVWRAVDRESGRPVAVKIMHVDSMTLEDVQRLAQEARILARLRHPCIVRVLGSGVTGADAPYLVLEWVDGINLREKLDREPVPARVEVSHIVSQICQGLAEAHTHDVIHRDVKPENVLLGGPEQLSAKLVDFGMAKELHGDVCLSLDGNIFGTPQYMAPERARGATVGAPADLYSVGIVTFEMLTGRRPFDGRSPAEVLMAQIVKPPPSLPGEPALERLLHAALAKKPEDRPTLPEFAGALARILS